MAYKDIDAETDAPTIMEHILLELGERTADFRL